MLAVQPGFLNDGGAVRNENLLKKILRQATDTPRLYAFVASLRPYIGRYFFVILCIVGLLWYAVYANYIIRRLQQEADRVSWTHAEVMRAMRSGEIEDNRLKTMLDAIIRESEIPMIIVDDNWRPVTWRNIVRGRLWWRELVPSDDPSRETRDFLTREARRLRKEHPPKILRGPDGTRKGYLVFGSTRVIAGLTWLPFVETILVTSFALFVYLALHNIRVTERSNLWVGLAKETAHQLGTPISSLMGWVEYMKAVGETPDEIDKEMLLEQLAQVSANMETDLTRLRKVTNRFSHIGSIPTLKPYDVDDIIGGTVDYFRTRLPLLKRKIEIHHYRSELPKVHLNRELVEWVFENLLKNAMDAIQRDDGLIEIRSEYIEVEKVVRIYHSDNGRGILWEDQKNVFSPGFTTKKRGWGLGLTLAKRIIEDYHRGRIFVKTSQRDVGTVFCIDLPVRSESA